MPMPEIVKVRFKSRFQPGEWSPREYSYYAAVPLKVGDLVVVPSKYGESVAKVSQVHVDEREVRDYLHTRNTCRQTCGMLTRKRYAGAARLGWLGFHRTVSIFQKPKVRRL